MKKFFALLFCLVALAGIGHSASIIMRCGTAEPLEGSPIGEMLVRFKETVEKNSNNDIEVRLYPSAQLGGLREMLEATKMGNQEVVVCTPAWGSAFIPQLSVLSFPYMFKSDEIAYKLLDGEIGDELAGYAEKAGFKILGYPCFGYRQITNSVRPIRTLEDFAGIKLRLQSDPVHIAALKALGANPVAMSSSEVYSALQQKVIDGQENSTTSTLVNRYHENQKYLSLTKVFFDSWAIFMNKPFFDRLPENYRKLVTDAADEAVAIQRQVVAKYNQNSLETLRQHIEVNEVAPEELARMAERTKEVYGMFDDKIGADLVRKVMKAIAENE